MLIRIYSLHGCAQSSLCPSQSTLTHFPSVQVAGAKVGDTAVLYCVVKVALQKLFSPQSRQVIGLGFTSAVEFCASLDGASVCASALLLCIPLSVAWFCVHQFFIARALAKVIASPTSLRSVCRDITIGSCVLLLLLFCVA